MPTLSSTSWHRVPAPPPAAAANSGAIPYPQFGYNDFHSGDITNYGDSNNVWNGALYGMPDLNTGSSLRPGSDRHPLRRPCSAGAWRAFASMRPSTWRRPM